jgi:hypothetical protein
LHFRHFQSAAPDNDGGHTAVCEVYSRKDIKVKVELWNREDGKVMRTIRLGDVIGVITMMVDALGDIFREAGIASYILWVERWEWQCSKTSYSCG